MVNLFRLLGLPNPKSNKSLTDDELTEQTFLNSEAGESIIHLSDIRISKWSQKMSPKPTRKVIYLKPDNLHRLNLTGMEKELKNGNLILVNLKDLIHMPSQTAKCTRVVRELAENNELTVFALNDADTLLMIPGLNMRVDTHKHVLGLSKIA